MSFVIQCPSCPTQLSVEDDMIGQQVSCPKCETILEVEAPAGPKPRPRPAPTAGRTQSKPSATKKPAPPVEDELEEIEELEDVEELEEADDDRPKKRGSGARIGVFAIMAVVGLCVGAAAGYFSLRSIINPAATSSSSATEGTPKPPAAPPDDLLYLPNGCQAIAVINVPKLLASDSYKKLDSAGYGIDSAQIELVRQMTGLQPDEIDRISVGLVPAANEFAIVIRSSKTVRKDELVKDAKAVSVGNQELYIKPPIGTFFVPDEHTIVLASTDSMLQAIIKRKSPASLPGGLKTAYKPIDQTWAVWVGIDATVVDGFAGVPGFNPAMFQDVKALVVESPADAPLTFQLVIKCKDANAAGTVGTQFNLMIQQAKQSVPAELRDAVNSVKFEVAKTDVAAKVVIPHAVILEPLRGLKWENPEFWVETLTDDNKADQERARKLLSANPDRGVPVLMRALDKGGKTRTEAMIVLADMKERGKAAAPAVAKLLNEPRKDDRIQALQTLDAFGVDTLKAFRADLRRCEADKSDADISRIAGKMLAKLGGPSPEEKAQFAAQMAADARDATKDVNARLTAVQGLAAPDADSDARIPALLKVLEDKDKDLRTAAIVTLGKVGAKNRDALYAPLVAALNDADGGVSTAAGAALEAFGMPTDKECALLLGLLKDPNSAPAILTTAAKLIAKAGPAAGKDAFPVLFAALENADAGVRAACGAALEALPPDAFDVPALVRKLGEEKATPEVKGFVLKKLGKFGDKLDRTKVPTLAQTLLRTIESDETLREPALLVLGNLGPPAEGDVPQLMKLLDPKLPAATRGFAARVLAPLAGANAEVAKKLLAGLGDADATIRKLSAEGLARAGLKTPEAAQVFAKALDDSDPSIRLNVTRALSAMPPEAKASGFLLKAYGDADEAVRKEAMGGLKNVQKFDAAVLLGALGNRSAPLRIFALEKLVSQKEPVDKDVIVQLDRLVTDDDPQVRSLTVNALVGSGAEPDLLGPSLLKAMNVKDNPDAVKMTALDALLKLKQQTAVLKPLLLKAALDKGDPLHLKAVESLGKLGDFTKADLKPLMDALKNPDTRESAAESLAGIGKPAAQAVTDELASIKTNENPALQIVLLGILEKIGPAAKGVALGTVLKKIGSPFAEVKLAAKKASDAIQKK